MSIGENIRKARENQNITQCELAKSVGISQSMIAQIERGSKSCGMSLGAQIAEALKCSILDLYGKKEA